MGTKKFRIVTARRAVATVALVAAAGLFASCSSGSESGAGQKAGTGNSTGASTTTRAPGSSTADPASLTVVLQRAVEEERHAEATYRNVITALGATRPFTNIANSEAQHVSALEQLAVDHQVDVSQIAPAGEPSPATKQAACQLGVDAEKADIALYDELLPQVTDRPDVVAVFERLRAASQDKHLPAFERCN